MNNQSERANAMYHDKTIAVVIPIYNEEKLIDRVIEAMPSFVDVIVCVDDRSTDRSLDVVRQYQEREKDRLVLIQNESNAGCGGALAKGYEWARDRGADIAVRMDGDAQMNPDDLTALLDPVVEDRCDYAKGNRLFTGEAYRKIPKMRYFGNAVLSLLTKVASGYWHVADSQSGYTAMNRRVLTTIDWPRMYKRYGQPNDLLVRLNVNGFRVMDVPVKPIYNIGEVSGIKIHAVVFSISWLLVKLFVWRLKEKYVIRDFHPLVLFYLLGFSLLALSLGLFIRLLLFWAYIGHIPPINALAWMFSLSIGFQSVFFAMWFDMENNRLDRY